MAQSSPALALGDTTAQIFRFAPRSVLRVQVRFFSSLEGEPAADLGYASGGSRSVEVRPISSVAQRGGSYIDYSAVSRVDGGTSTLTAGEWTGFDLISDTVAVEITASAGSNPGSAQSYRIWVDVEANTAGG